VICFEQTFGPEIYFATIAGIVLVLVRVIKRIPWIHSNGVPLLAFALGYAIDVAASIWNCGQAPALAALSSLAGGVSGLAAAGGHEALMRTAKAVGLERFAVWLLGRADHEQTKRGKGTTAIVLLALFLAGCSGAFELLAKVSQGAQWLGTVVDVAEAGAGTYFDRHPNQDAQKSVADAMRKVRRALGALDAALATAEAADDQDVTRAKREALRAYAELRSLLSDLGVLSATPPAGGAETTSPKPEPFDLPSSDEIGAVL